MTYKSTSHKRKKKNLSGPWSKHESLHVSRQNLNNAALMPARPQVPSVKNAHTHTETHKNTHHFLRLRNHRLELIDVSVKAASNSVTLIVILIIAVQHDCLCMWQPLCSLLLLLLLERENKQPAHDSEELHTLTQHTPAPTHTNTLG